jgi:RimJ/RimL family protein N-acetyltransferase
MNTAPVIPDSTRLRYRLMDARDKQLWWEVDQDPEVMRFLNDGKPTTWDEIENFIVPRVASFSDAASGRGLWELADRHSGEHLGWILVRHYRFDRPDCERDNIELGWRLKRSHWRRGLTTEGARAIVDVLQQDPAIRVFSAMAHPDNVASTGVMTKLGMRYVDERVHHVADRQYPAAYYEMPSPGFAKGSEL